MLPFSRVVTSVVVTAGGVRITINAGGDMFRVEGAVTSIEACDKGFETGHCG